jgi:magnesium-protoporphyrin O-methyltransferase
MRATNYIERRQEIKAYFDRTAAETWSRLTSDAPVSRIRATVRAGRDRMRNTLLDWLPTDLSGRTLLDAGCGTGALAIEAARRGADVVAIDLSPTLVGIGRQRTPVQLGNGSIRFLSGDMLDEELGPFDHAVAMDSLIHYKDRDAVAALTRLTPRIRHSILFTFAPRTVPLTMMHNVGKLFPRGDRAPAIEPVAEVKLRALLGEPQFAAWSVGRTTRIVSGFYTSQAMELTRS